MTDTTRDDGLCSYCVNYAATYLVQSGTVRTGVCARHLAVTVDRLDRGSPVTVTSLRDDE